MSDLNAPLSVPDRFESLNNRANEKLGSIVVPIAESLAVIDKIYSQMASAGRGGFLILRGDSGAGKSTFLHTVGLFRENVKTISVPSIIDIRKFFETANDEGHLSIFVLEEREALTSFSDELLESWLHSINGYIRSPKGHQSIVVWPCNTDILLNRIKELAESIGGNSLLSVKDGFSKFAGPSKSAFPKIAENTIAQLNQGATFADLGISPDTVSACVDTSKNIGAFMGHIRDEIQKSEQYVQSLVAQEQCRLWIIVAAGNEPSQEVAALTRGRSAATDIERLMSATEANIVKYLKKYPEKIGILATLLDAKILYLPVTTAMSIVRAYSETALKKRMKDANLSVKPDTKTDALDRLNTTEIARMLRSEAQTVLTRGTKLGSSSQEAFGKLTDLASTNDIALNKAFGDALVDLNLVKSFKTEVDFGKGLTRTTDLLCEANMGRIRIEIMWRKKTSRAEIANYTLSKIYNYGKALGYLE